jgi:hypothetical protein
MTIGLLNRDQQDESERVGVFLMPGPDRRDVRG